MDAGSEAADLMVREGLQITEATIIMQRTRRRFRHLRRWRWRGCP